MENLLKALLLAVAFAVSHSTLIKLPLVINTWGFEEANEAAWDVISSGKGNALDALVEGCSTCERLQCDGTVGFGGSPDESGETRLDALVIDGKTMNMGAVAAMREIKDAIKVARYVLEHTDHTLLVGEAASDFAAMMGFKREPLTTPQSKELWKKWQQNNCQPNFWHNVLPNPSESCGPYRPLSEAKSSQCRFERERYLIDRYNHDTIGMIVIDENREIFAGTSTNGAKYKIPGRCGDSAIPGAGAYADNEVGAAVATGDGDIMMRFLPSLLAVEGLRSGLTADKAAQNAMERIRKFHPKFSGGLVVADKLGNYGAACVGLDRFPFSVANGGIERKNATRVEYRTCLKYDFL